MTTTLITGGNKGLGYETARRLLESGHDVWIGARDAERGEQAAADLGARFVQLDVTDDHSVEQAAKVVDRLDVLINNAGISGGVPANDIDQVTPDVMRSVYETNVFGVVRVTRACLPALRNSDNPLVINVSSGLGSIAQAADPNGLLQGRTFVTYASSKSALNMMTVQYAAAVPDVRFVIADPGYTKTDFNGNQGTQTVSEGTDAIVELATSGPGGPNQVYLSRHGVVPW